MKGICVSCAAFARRLSKSKTQIHKKETAFHAKNDETAVV
jgi:hypothetical protein